jgi:putative DNA primase/helicase
VPLAVPPRQSKTGAHETAFSDIEHGRGLDIDDRLPPSAITDGEIDGQPSPPPTNTQFVAHDFVREGLPKPQARHADPGVIAADILSRNFVGGFPVLRYWNESFWRWEHGRYVEVPPTEVRALVVNHMDPNWAHVKGEHISNVVEHLRAKTLLPSSVSPPLWLSDSQPAGFDARDCLPTRNHIVHLPSVVAGSSHYSVPATPTFFTTTACECDLDRSAQDPKDWIAFLTSVWGQDRQSIDTLQEFFGYFLTADTRQQKMLLLVGPKRGGKGTIARVLRRLVGECNVAGPTLASLATNFGLSALVGRSLAIVSDARMSGKLDQATVVERLLAITGEDKVTIDRKHRPAIHCKLPTRIFMLSNELPRLSDASGTIVSRFIVLKTSKSFFGQEDPMLTEKLIAELPGILRWAIDGWQRLQKRGHFVQPANGFGSVETMIDLASPVTAFVRDCCVVDPMASVETEALFRAWVMWSTQQGQRNITNTQTFGRDLHAAYPGVHTSLRRQASKRMRVYKGIALRPDASD